MTPVGHDGFTLVDSSLVSTECHRAYSPRSEWSHSV